MCVMLGVWAVFRLFVYCEWITDHPLLGKLILGDLGVRLQKCRRGELVHRGAGSFSESLAVHPLRLTPSRWPRRERVHGKAPKECEEH